MDTLIRNFPDSPEKMAVLRLLVDQMILLLKTGKMNPSEFYSSLESNGLQVSDPGSITRCIELDTFYKQVLNSITYDTILVTGTDFRFSVESLYRLSTIR